jgi:hypothetical protein
MYNPLQLLQCCSSKIGYPKVKIYIYIYIYYNIYKYSSIFGLRESLLRTATLQQLQHLTTSSFPINNYSKTCKKSQKGVYLQRQKSQKGVKYGRREISKRCKQHHYEAENIPATP